VKLQVDIDSEEKNISRAIYAVYVDIKKREIKKEKLPEKMETIQCDCKEKTSYKVKV
jgi:hypothetical protein